LKYSDWRRKGRREEDIRVKRNRWVGYYSAWNKSWGDSAKRESSMEIPI